MAIKPTLVVEWEFDAGVWTNVAADVVSITTRRGRNVELGAYETGAMTVVLRNEDRDYDPDNAAGPHYGALRPNRRIRFLATYNAVTYPVFVGYVNRITQTYDDPNGITATVDLSDRFKLLNRAELPRSVYTTVMDAAAPLIWFRLDEPEGATVARNSGTLGSDYDGAIETDFSFAIPPAGGPEFGAESLVVHDGGTAAAFDDEHWAEITVPNFSVGSGATKAFAIEAWIRIEETPDPFGFTRLFFQQGIGLTGAGIGFAIMDDLKPRLVMYNDAGTAYAVRTSSALALGERYHLVARHDSDGTMHVFVNGTDVTAADLGVGGTASGTFTKGAGDVYALDWKGITATIDELAIYAQTTGEALSGGVVPVHNAAGRTPWAGDPSGTRLARILELGGVEPADYDLDAGAQTLQATDLGGSTLAYAQKIEQTELGALFVTRAGIIRFIARDALQTGDYLTPVATLMDDPAGDDVPYRTVAFEVDEADVITRATVSRLGSIAVTYSDPDALDEFGPIDFTADGLLHDDDGYSADYAEWVVNTHRTPATRVGTVTLRPPIAPTVAYPAILGAEIADRVTLTRRPNVGAAITGDYRIESIAHQVGAGWDTTLELSPWSTGEDNLPVFVWDVTTWDNHVWGL